MNDPLSRRRFLKYGAATTLSAAAAGGAAQSVGAVDKPVRVGMVGVGGRGRTLLENLLVVSNVSVGAICDINAGNLARAQDMVETAGQKKPDGYSRDEESYRDLMERDDLDAVVIATPWNWHTPMAVHAMKSGKYAAVEVPAATTMEECWRLVHTYEQTRVPCMMLENWSFRRDNLAVLNMIRKGMFGDIVHCHCAHSHNTLDHWYFDGHGRKRWGADFLLKHNRDQYPTHSLGPVLSWMNLNCGDYFDYVSSMATRSLGPNRYFEKGFGPDHPYAKREFKQGDIVTTTVKTKKGNTIVINNDMQLPRPYDNRWMIQGTEGIYKEQTLSRVHPYSSEAEVSVIYIAGRNDSWPKEAESHNHRWESFKPYQDEYEHSWWKARKSQAGGHGGVDLLELQQFLKAVREKTQTPIDVYDSALFSVIIPLSEQSIAMGSAPVKCPDFTRGRWKTRKPSFAVEG